MLASTCRAGTDLRLIGPSSVRRRLTVKPGMCGQSSQLVAQIGDWTWETVRALCGTNVFNARNASGAPTYLAFYYFHVKASPVLHLQGLSFGDEIEVVSSLFDCGSESILTLHRISLAADGETAAGPVEPEEIHDRPRADCLYVETFNRWITRGPGRGNRDLVRSSPVDFRHDHLPAPPDRCSPRLACHHARRDHTFLDPRTRQLAAAAGELRVDYPIDVTRDINGVGLVYFAAYFSILDRALLELWRHRGKSDRSFLDRVVLDHRLCYLGNADIDSVLRIHVKAWRRSDDPDVEIFDAAVADRDSGRVIAVSAVHALAERAPGAGV